MTIRYIFFLVFCFGFIQSCGSDSKSEKNKAEEERRQAGEAFKKRYMFDIDSEESACNKAKEISLDYSVTLESCSWKEQKFMELSVVKGDQKHTKTLTTVWDPVQDYRLFADVNDEDLGNFFLRMNQVIRFVKNQSRQ